MPQPAPPREYEMPMEASEARIRLRDRWRRERAGIVRDLLACAPIETQAEAMDLIFQMEHAHAAYTGALQEAWHQSAQHAYSEGLQVGVIETVIPLPAQSPTH